MKYFHQKISLINCKMGLLKAGENYHIFDNFEYFLLFTKTKIEIQNVWFFWSYHKTISYNTIWCKSGSIWSHGVHGSISRAANFSFEEWVAGRVRPSVCPARWSTTTTLVVGMEQVGIILSKEIFRRTPPRVLVTSKGVQCQRGKPR